MVLKCLKGTVITCIGVVSFNVQAAALVPGTTLLIAPTQYVCSVGGVYPNCDSDLSQIDNTGSWSAFDLQRDGVIDPIDQAAFNPGIDGGIILGEAQSFGEIEQPWQFLGFSSSHYTTAPISVVNDLGLTKELDFSGWSFDRSGFLSPLGGQSELGDTGLASITCETTLCGNGEQFTLSYSAHLPLDFDPGYEGMLYQLNLVGTIATVPVPASVWLFSYGLISLVGFARRHKG